MKTYNKLYGKIISFENLILAWQKARKGKTKKVYVINFEEELFCNLMALHYELKYKSYKPRELITFILRDPKTRVISKSDFRDRIIHHAICNMLEPIFDKAFISDSCANRIRKGNLFGLKRLKRFIRKVSKNGLIAKNKFQDNNYIVGYCLKADIKHYFEEVNHEVLINIIKKKVKDENVIWLIKQILVNTAEGISREGERLQGMPLGNLTSQFFANVYLNELDYFVKHKLKAKYYLRYVDDFVIFHEKRKKLEIYLDRINNYISCLKISLHQSKTKIFSLADSINFLGYRTFFHYTLLKKRNVNKFLTRFEKFGKLECLEGWLGYAKWANTYRLRQKIVTRFFGNGMYFNC